MKVVAQRSSLRMWLMAMAGIPLLVISLDVLTQRKLTRRLTEILFRPDDIQIYEPRDVIYAWVMFLFALFLVGFGLKELFWPTKVVECRPEGLALRLNAPYRPASVIPWANIQELGAAQVYDDGDAVDLLVISVVGRGDLPDNPWGARWLDERELGVMALDWLQDPQEVAEEIAAYAVEAEHRRARGATANLWKED